MTTKQKHISEVLNSIYELSQQANAECNEMWEKVEKEIRDLTDFSRCVGIQIGINRCLNLISDLWDKAMEEDKNE